MAKDHKCVCYYCGERRRGSKDNPPEGRCSKNAESEMHLWLDDKQVSRQHREYCRNKKAPEPLNAEQMYFLGKYYADSQEMEAAAKWFLKAAESGSVDAMFAMGNLYADGLGVNKNIGESVEWYRKAARRGNESAKQALFKLFKAGYVVETLEWLQQESTAGNHYLALTLAHTYENGNGIPQDKAKAMGLYRRVAKAVTVEPCFMIGGAMGGILWDGIIMDVMTQTDENNAYDMARRGYAYEHGKYGVSQDQQEAMKWYQKATAAGDGYAMFVLANEYEKGENQDKAFELYKKAAEVGFEYARKNGLEGRQLARAMTE